MSFRNIGPNIRILVLPILVLGVVVVVFAYLVKVGFSQVMAQTSKYKENVKNYQLLSEKLSVLREVRKGSLGQADKTLIALPVKNPASWMVSQFKSLVEASSLKLDSFELSSVSNDGDVKSATFSVKISGETPSSLLNFFKSLSTSAPISTLTSVDIKSVGFEGKYASDFELLIYWSDLPTTLPAIDEPVVNLTDSEMQTLEEVSKLTPPSFTLIEPSFTQGRPSPFN